MNWLIEVALLNRLLERLSQFRFCCWDGSRFGLVADLSDNAFYRWCCSIILSVMMMDDLALKDVNNNKARFDHSRIRTWILCLGNQRGN